MLKILNLPAFKDNYIWLISNPEISNSAVVVDPGAAQPVLTALASYGLQLAAILVTHHHADHIGGINDLVQHYQVPVYGPTAEAIAAVDHPLQENDFIQLDSIQAEFRVMDVPGHTQGHIAYYGHGLLFCGDTLFAGGCGRLFEGTAEQMYISLSKLSALPESTLVYCAHEYTAANLQFAQAVESKNPELQQRIHATSDLRARHQATVPSTIGLEKNTNPFLRTHVPEVIAAAEKFANASLSAPWQVFQSLRLWKDQFVIPPVAHIMK